MMKNKYLAKSISDAGWGEFLRQLEYKSEWKGKYFVRVEHDYPSSEICSVCSCQLEKLPLYKRKWTCPACGTVHNRDTNAAINIEERGLAILQSALGAERPEVTPVECALAGNASSSHHTLKQESLLGLPDGQPTGSSRHIH
jgi:putative transposase